MTDLFSKIQHWSVEEVMGYLPDGMCNEHDAAKEEAKRRMLELEVLKAKVEAMEKKAKEFIEADARRGANDIDYWCGQASKTIMRAGSEAEKKASRPYGCKCQDLAHKVAGDGCDECNPELAKWYKDHENDE